VGGLPSRVESGKRAWNLFVEKGLLDRRLVRAEVANSWQRCRRLHVDPFGPKDEIFNPSLLKQRLDQKQQLCRVARTFMEDLYSFLRGSQFQIVLTDENGLLLQVLGDSTFTSRTRQVYLYAGASWSEEDVGTNAIGTALAENKPIEIYAWEHFSHGNQFLVCTAAPIRDVSGSVIGILDVSGDYRYANPHTMGMVVATARAVEHQIRLEQLNRELQIASHYSRALLHGMSDGVIAFEINGVITEVNAKAGEILGMNPILAKGRPLHEIFGDYPTLLKVLSDNKEHEDEDIAIDKWEKRIRCSASSLRDETDTPVGVVAVFHEVNHRASVRRPVVIRAHRHGFEDIVGESPGMRRAKEWAQLASRGSSTVLILGESGTGKELFANAIHSASARREHPFVAINCAALPETLIESELFGYSEGSFTGAKRGGQPGRFEVANGGTVFLDEIGDMSLNVQAKLLRVLQEKKVSRIGSAVEIPVDTRIIAATHNDLKAQVERGAFREDLYYRLAVLEVHIPPLRERVEDIGELAKCLVGKVAAKLERNDVRIDNSFLAKLNDYTWPGNVRELENAIERAIVRMGSDNILTAELLHAPDNAVVNVTPPHCEPLAPSRQVQEDVRPLRELEKEAIARALIVCHGNIRRTAAQLGIGRNTLYRKMEEYELVPPQWSRRQRQPRSYEDSLSSVAN